MLNSKSVFDRHLQHDTRIESYSVIQRIDKIYDMLYNVGRIANSFFDTKRLSYIFIPQYKNQEKKFFTPLARPPQGCHLAFL